MEGKFITLEGIEGSGKSTNLSIIKQLLDDNQINYIVTREPGGGPLGPNLREILLDKSNVISPTVEMLLICLLYTSPSPRDRTRSRMPSSA